MKENFLFSGRTFLGLLSLGMAAVYIYIYFFPNFHLTYLDNVGKVLLSTMCLLGADMYLLFSLLIFLKGREKVQKNILNIAIVIGCLLAGRYMYYILFF